MRAGFLIAGADTVRQKAQAVQHDQHGASLMSDHSERKRQIEEQAAGDQHQHRPDREDEVLPDDPGCPPYQAVRISFVMSSDSRATSAA